ncbi:MAG: sigma-70 family RNA polymerase sigma factor [Acidobacteriota bacterium]|nr:sigma-70 family RNA polymerase sigma factor [Acidobacteriota bacterium]MDE3043591.1 sigma-70 family RNA polymerase sigma factor [Acidobacteriota bacterium]MDE3107478.1 sigma-70 family RNA polymerase sigma factor [Acidobacteriota bacterium]MDE3222597.1 sigma-70 family RNA polymerase sigma factor [Acidobacteriota bacterium]
MGVKSVGDEATVWAAVLDHDADAFVAIFDQHRDRVFRHALRMTANVHDAEDVTAGAFFELWRRQKSVRVVDGSVLPWLLVTTTNLARNLTRGLRRYRALIDSLPRAQNVSSAEDVALEHFEELRIAAQIKEALGGLSAADAALITLTMFEHYSTAQIAAALGITDGAARTRLSRARGRMADLLVASEHDENAAATKEKSR